jgi:hypothetical protein
MYINAASIVNAHIAEGLKDHTDYKNTEKYTHIKLYDLEFVRVKETPEQIHRMIKNNLIGK